MSKNSFSKKEQFTQPSKSKMPLFAAVFGVVLVAIIVFIAFRPNKIEEVGYFGDVVASPRSYIGEVISMTSVEPVIESNLVKIPLSQVSENNIVSFEIANSEGDLVPLMAYITPTGRLFAGSSMCEPCGGRTFSSPLPHPETTIKVSISNNTKKFILYILYFFIKIITSKLVFPEMIIFK